MVVYNVTCNVALEVEKKWLEWIDKQLNDLSKSENINTTSILKLNSTATTEGLVYAIQYQISDQNTLDHFINNEGKILKKKIRNKFGEGVLHFCSQLEIIKEYP